MGLNALLRDMEQAGEIARIAKTVTCCPRRPTWSRAHCMFIRLATRSLPREKHRRTGPFIAAENTGNRDAGDKVVADHARCSVMHGRKADATGRKPRDQHSGSGHDTIVGTSSIENFF